MSMESIISALPETPVGFESEMVAEDFANLRLNRQITNYDSARGDTTGLGWVRRGDPRSELVLSLFKEGIGLPLLLNDCLALEPRNLNGSNHRRPNKYLPSVRLLSFVEVHTMCPLL